jgi:hypothetical protein
MNPTAEQIATSHLVAAANDCRTAALRRAKDIDNLMSDLRHAIENGRTGAALSMLTSIDTLNKQIISSTITPISAD